MKPNHARRKTGGFTGWDLAIVAGTIGFIVAGMLLPSLSKAKGNTCRVNCVANLKQVGLAFRVWSNDSSERFPWAVSTNEGGTLELVQEGSPIPHFRAMSNEINTPKILVCPQDNSRVKSPTFDQLGHHYQLSYFVGLDSTERQPASILSGDRTFSIDGYYHSGLVAWSTNSSLKWAPWIHSSGLGNVAFGDGSVRQISDGAAVFQNAAYTNPVVRLVIP